MQWFDDYFIISGLLTFLWFWCSMNSNKEEAEDAIADITWNTGFKREHVKALFYAYALLFGWFILPYEIISYLKGFIKGLIGKED